MSRLMYDIDLLFATACLVLKAISCSVLSYSTDVPLAIFLLVFFLFVLLFPSVFLVLVPLFVLMVLWCSRSTGRKFVNTTQNPKIKAASLFPLEGHSAVDLLGFRVSTNQISPYSFVFFFFCECSTKN
jgi:hypothetical protein